jgi:hypothetical protein
MITTHTPHIINITISITSNKHPKFKIPHQFFEKYHCEFHTFFSVLIPLHFQSNILYEKIGNECTYLNTKLHPLKSRQRTKENCGAGEQE